MLEDGRDSVRNAGLLLLIDLTSGTHEDLQKIVAFEDVFSKVFAMIQMEGGLADAGIIAQDCLTLLANLVKGCASNQTIFRESGCVNQLVHLLAQAFPPAAEESPFASKSREKSAFGLLQLLRLFLVPGEQTTLHNQVTFSRAGIGQTLVDLGFSSELSSPIRTVSLQCAADCISLNAPLQESFASLTIAEPSDASSDSSPSVRTNGARHPKSSIQSSSRSSVERTRSYIIEALLDLSLQQSHADVLLRAAASKLIQAYLGGHNRIRLHFIQRAISGHAQNESAANVLTTVAQGTADPTGLAFASWIVQDLVADAEDAKSLMLAVKEGEAGEDEDVLSLLQSIGSRLERLLQQANDEQSVAAYTSLLVVFLWNFAPGVNDVLADGSGLVQALITAVLSSQSTALVKGLCAVLLGTLYEFSTKDSPIARRTLAPLLTQKLGRIKYLEALASVRRHPAVRDYSMFEEDGSETTLSGTVVDLLTVEYSRLRMIIDKDPGLEVQPPSAAEAGVDRDVLDVLRQQIQTCKDNLARAQEEAVAADQNHDQEKMAVSKEAQTSAAEVERLRKINQAMQQGHDSELSELRARSEQAERILRVQHEQALENAKKAAEAQMQAAVSEACAASKEQLKEAEKRLKELQSCGFADLEKELEAARTVAPGSFTSDAIAKLEQELVDAKAEAEDSKAELESMLLVMGDIESKRDAYRSRVKDLGGEISEDGEGNEDDDGEESDGTDSEVD